MAWSFNLTTGDVIEATISYVALDQLLQYKWDLRIGGTGVNFTSDQLADQVDIDWQVFCPLIGTSTTHVQSRYQIITDVVPGTGGRPRRVRGFLDKRDRTTLLNGLAAPPFAPMSATASVQLITSGAPGPFWGKKGFGQLPVSSLGSNGELLATTAKNAWELAATTFFAAAHAITGTTLTYTPGILPSTFVANQALPHVTMSTYFLPFIGVYTGTYIGSQMTRDISPQGTLGH